MSFDIGQARRDAEQRVTEYLVIEKMATALLKPPHGPERKGISMSSQTGDVIEVSSTWLAVAISQARSEGFSDGRSIVQPLCDWANASTKGWRDALAEHIKDAPELLAVLDTMLERA